MNKLDKLYYELMSNADDMEVKGIKEFFGRMFGGGRNKKASAPQEKQQPRPLEMSPGMTQSRRPERFYPKQGDPFGYNIDHYLQTYFGVKPGEDFDPRKLTDEQKELYSKRRIEENDDLMRQGGTIADLRKQIYEDNLGVGRYVDDNHNQEVEDHFRRIAPNVAHMRTRQGIADSYFDDIERRGRREEVGRYDERMQGLSAFDDFLSGRRDRQGNKYEDGVRYGEPTQQSNQGTNTENTSSATETSMSPENKSLFLRYIKQSNLKSTTKSFLNQILK